MTLGSLLLICECTMALHVRGDGGDGWMKDERVELEGKVAETVSQFGSYIIGCLCLEAD